MKAQTIFAAALAPLLSLALLFAAKASGEAAQHKPISSPLSHSLFLGYGVEGKGAQAKGGFLSYQFFPEALQPLSRVFLWGAEGAGARLSKGFSGYACRGEGKFTPLFLGLSARLRLFERFQPFIGAGAAKFFCGKRGFGLNLIEAQGPNKEAAFYLSLGFALSFKNLDRSAIYGMDSDYGLNDLSLKAGCRAAALLQKDKLVFCQIGLELLL